MGEVKEAKSTLHHLNSTYYHLMLYFQLNTKVCLYISTHSVLFWAEIGSSVAYILLSLCSSYMHNPCIVSHYISHHCPVFNFSTKESLHLTNKKQKSREDHLKQCQADTKYVSSFLICKYDLTLWLFYFKRIATSSYYYTSVWNARKKRTEVHFG